MPLPTRGLVRGHRSARVDRRTSVALCRGRMRRVASARHFTFEGVHGPPLFKARSPRSYTVPAESGATHATVAVAATILLPVVNHFPYKNLYVYRLRPQNLILQFADCGSREPTLDPGLRETAKIAFLTFSVFDPRLQGSARRVLHPHIAI